MTQATDVIAGAGLAGARAAEALREEGFDGRVVLLLGREPDPPYDRPPLPKGYLRGEGSAGDALVLATGFWDAQGVELRTGTTASAIDLAAREVVLGDGGRALRPAPPRDGLRAPPAAEPGDRPR